MPTFGELTSGDCQPLPPPPPIKQILPNPGDWVIFSVSGRLLANPGRLMHIRV